MEYGGGPIQGRSQDWYWGGGGGPKVATVSDGGMPSGIFHVIMLLPRQSIRLCTLYRDERHCV